MLVNQFIQINIKTIPTLQIIKATVLTLLILPTASVILLKVLVSTAKVLVRTAKLLARRAKVFVVLVNTLSLIKV